jgi:hypothetical protein
MTQFETETQTAPHQLAEPDPDGPLVGIIMGSQSDMELMQKAGKVLEEAEVTFELHVMSAHRHPDKVAEYCRTARQRGLRVIIAGARGTSTTIRGSDAATSATSSLTFNHSVSPASITASNRWTSRASPSARSTSTCSASSSSAGGICPRCIVWAMPRMTVTGVRSSWPTRPISCWRWAARSNRASCASSSWRARRRSRSSASVISSITTGVTSGDSIAPPLTASRTACTIASESEPFKT